jgi:hypothetical protein
MLRLAFQVVATIWIRKGHSKGVDKLVLGTDQKNLDEAILRMTHFNILGIQISLGSHANSNALEIYLMTLQYLVDVWLDGIDNLKCFSLISCIRNMVGRTSQSYCEMMMSPG